MRSIDLDLDGLLGQRDHGQAAQQDLEEMHCVRNIKDRFYQFGTED